MFSLSFPVCLYYLFLVAYALDSRLESCQFHVALDAKKQLSSCVQHGWQRTSYKLQILMFSLPPSPQLGQLYPIVAQSFKKTSWMYMVLDSLERTRVEDIQPNSITFLSIMDMCSHVALLEQGEKFFDDLIALWFIYLLIQEISIRPNVSWSMICQSCSLFFVFVKNRWRYHVMQMIKI